MFSLSHLALDAFFFSEIIKDTPCFICLSIAQNGTVYNVKYAQDGTINIVKNVNLHAL
nr:MAG TPA: pleckstrin-like domain protein [Bacteriophage sp.]